MAKREIIVDDRNYILILNRAEAKALLVRLEQHTGTIESRAVARVRTALSEYMAEET